MYEPELSALREKVNEHMPKGHLTYLLYSIAIKFFKDKKSYDTISTAKSSSDDTTDEINIRHLKPREDQKIKENGDVY